MMPDGQDSTTREEALIPVMELRHLVIYVFKGKRKKINKLSSEALMGSTRKSIERLLTGESDPNAASYSGKTCLHHIARLWGPGSGSYINNWVRNLLQTLIKAGADVNKRDNSGMTSLHYAAMQENAEMIRILLSAGAEPDPLDNEKNTPLLLAVENSKTGSNAMIFDAAQQLIKGGANVDAASNSGGTALHCACERGYEEIVNLFLTHGASVTATDKNGFNALLRAAKSNNTEIVRILIDSGSDVNHVIGTGESAEPMTAVHYAISNDNMEMLEYLLEHGADPNRLKSMGKSILVYVLSDERLIGRKIPILKLLLSHKADLLDDDLRNAVSLFKLLVLEGRVDETRLLLEHGFDFSRFSPRAPEHLSPLHECLWRGYSSTAYYRLLVWLECDKKRSLDLNHIDLEGRTPLSLAAEMGQIPYCMSLLIEWGADVDRVNSRRLSPLRVAVSAVDKTLRRSSSLNFLGIRLLVEAGAKLGNILNELVPDPPTDVGAQLVEARNPGQSQEVTQCLEKAQCIVKYRALFESQKKIADPSEHVAKNLPVKLRHHYDSCNDEIYWLKNTKFYNSLTYHNVLDKNFYRRVREDQAYEAFDEEYVKGRCSLYGSDLLWHFKHMKEMHEIWENAVKNLGFHLGLHHDTHYLIIDNILKRLRYKDLSSVAKSI